MDSHTSCSFSLLVIFSLLCLQSRADCTGSVLFIDSPTRQYLRPQAQIDSMELHEVGAAVSVLLGFAPPAKLSAASSSKLNEVLIPNPFNRPHAVFVLEVRGVKDSQVIVDSDRALIGNSLRSKVTFSSNKADIQLPDEDEVSVFSLNEHFSADSDAECTDKELSDFASWLGGSYVTDTLEPLNGELSIPLTNGAHLDLHMSKKADRAFTTSLVYLIRNFRRAMEMHQDLSGSPQNPAELISGSFDGIQVLREQYGTEGVAQQGMELFFALISKIINSLQSAYKGQIVGLMFFNEIPPPESQTMLNAVFTSRPSARSLEETIDPSEIIIELQKLLVRRVLAWITGIILLIATLLGIYYLVNMPITRDTLLYSNVKLD